MNQAFPSTWQITSARAVHTDRPCLLAILNTTPDSFSDGGQLDTIKSVVQRAQSAIDEGADILDIGGESTRPGAARIDSNEQIRRVVPAIKGIREQGITAPITIDTTRYTVAQAALDAGADAINDVSAGTEDSSMLQLACDRGCGIILMHRLCPPEQDQYSDQYREQPMYTDVVDEVHRYLDERCHAALAAGIGAQQIMIDPGLGFGKSVEQNLALINRTGELCSLGYPVLSGLSRKSFVGRISLGRDSKPSERIEGSIACSVVHLMRGARFFRVHDVAEHRKALDAAWAAGKSLIDPSH
ncbi:MAG: dihydropteroate synthase [Phycisphaerales bacterium]|nr:dihydropteroate synthase [Phycisphaerales bacterium]